MKTFTAPEYLLDTNVVLEGFWGKEPVAGLMKGWIKEGKIALSVVTVGEILSRASREESEKLSLLISRFGALPIDELVAQIAGEYRRRFLNKTKKVYLLDCFIAATAKVYNLKLVTWNVKDYPMQDLAVIVPGKKIKAA